MILTLKMSGLSMWLKVSALPNGGTWFKITVYGNHGIDHIEMV